MHAALHRQQELLVVVVARLAADEAGRHRLQRATGSASTGPKGRRSRRRCWRSRRSAGCRCWSTTTASRSGTRWRSPNTWPSGSRQAPLARRSHASARARAASAPRCTRGFAALRERCPMNIEASLPEVGARVLAEWPDVAADLRRIDAMWREPLAESRRTVPVRRVRRRRRLLRTGVRARRDLRACRSAPRRSATSSACWRCRRCRNGAPPPAPSTTSWPSTSPTAAALATHYASGDRIKEADRSPLHSAPPVADGDSALSVLAAATRHEAHHAEPREHQRIGLGLRNRGVDRFDLDRHVVVVEVACSVLVGEQPVGRRAVAETRRPDPSARPARSTDRASSRSGSSARPLKKKPKASALIRASVNEPQVKCVPQPPERSRRR